MSDPFDAFEASMTTTTTTTTNAEAFGDDPAADFLAREQAELDKIENNNQISDDPFGSFNGNNDLIKSTGEPTTTNTNLVNGFESESNIFGDSNTNEPISENKSNQDWIVVDENNALTNEPEQNKDVYSAIQSMDKLSVEPDKIKKWREEQKIRLETKDAEEEAKKKELKESAKKELDDWYKKRAEQLGRTHDNNKASDAELIAARESATGSDWERLAKLCEFNPKANKNNRDVSRMRSILLQLKQQPLVR